MGFLGFKFYSPRESCCEICAREPLCKYWVSPPLSITPGWSRWNGCELFFEQPVDSQDHAMITRQIRRRSKIRRLFSSQNMHLPANESKLHPHFRSIHNMSDVDYTHQPPLIFHGKPHNLETMSFIGCGWSFWHTQTYACLDTALDDAVPVFPSNTFTLPSNMGNLPVKYSVDESSRRECGLKDEYPQNRFSMMTDSGRWVRLPWPNETECPRPMQFDPERKSFELVEFDGDHPRCWFRDDLSIIGQRCVEYCAHNEYHHPWVSSLKVETKHNSIWKNYNCDYIELTNAELQKCVDSKRIGSYKVEGASIAQFLSEFLLQRFASIKLYNDTETPVTLTLSTFRIPHLLWHLNETQMRATLEAAPLVGENEENYYLTGYYYTSEREPWVTVDHAESLAELMQEILIPKGWRMINGFDVSAAFTYEVATQDDGLHMIGGPVKMVITKLLHHVCRDHL